MHRLVESSVGCIMHHTLFSEISLASSLHSINDRIEYRAMKTAMVDNSSNHLLANALVGHYHISAGVLFDDLFGLVSCSNSCVQIHTLVFILQPGK